MASRSSSHFNTEMYQGSRRGRSMYGAMDFSMFPSKYESTDIVEDPNELSELWRDTLKDRSPDNSRLMAHEETRRNTFARDRLNLRDGGARTTTDPYKNESFDTQFRDKDPRGVETAQNWKEYRRHVENQLRMTDFKDDSDYSTTSGSIHPNTLYKAIRGSQNWLKARLKIFETALENRHTGGTGVYENISNVFKQEVEDTSVMVDGSSIPLEDPVNRARLTTVLSNWVHGGSAALRANTTTDHKVKVASYGKLMRQRGLINHENQLRLVEDDTKRSIIEGISNKSTSNLVKLMSNAVDGSTAMAVGRAVKQGTMDAPSEMERFKGMKYSDNTVDNRNNILTRDIMSLLGITESEVKFLESMQVSNTTQAQQSLANLYKMAEVVHRLPMHAKLQVRDELLLKASGAGLTPSTPGGIKANREQVVVNPKIVQYMDLMVRKNKNPDEVKSLMELGVIDSEGKLKTWMSNAPLLVNKSAARDSENIISNRHDTDINHKKLESRKVHSYKTLNVEGSFMDNRDESILDRIINEVDNGIYTPGKNMGDTHDIRDNMNKSDIDNEFFENLTFNKHSGLIRDKRIAMNMVDSDAYQTSSEITRTTARPKWR